MRMGGRGVEEATVVFSSSFFCLMGGDLGSFSVEPGGIPVGQGTYEVIDIRGCRGIDDFFVSRTLSPVGDVVCDGALKQPGVLQDHAEGATYLVAGQLGVVRTVEPDVPGVDLVEAYEQVDECGLACAGGADDRDALAGGHVEGEVFDEGLVWLVTE